MKKTICVDFDGVIATYDGWKGFDVLGDPITEVIKVMKQLKEEGYHIIILTTRSDTPKLRKWLKDNNVMYDSLNSNGHNPECTSFKPMYDCIIDDRAVNFNLATNKMSRVELIKKIKGVVRQYEK